LKRKKEKKTVLWPLTLCNQRLFPQNREPKPSVWSYTYPGMNCSQGDQISLVWKNHPKRFLFQLFYNSNRGKNVAQKLRQWKKPRCSNQSTQKDKKFAQSGHPDCIA
jgi:hypothetical protein